MNTLMENGVQLTLEQWMPEIFQKPIAGASAHLAKISASQESVQDLTATEAALSEKFLESLTRSRKKIDPNGLSMKTLGECLAAIKDLTSCPYCLNWIGGGTTQNGRYLTLNTTAYHKTGNVSILSDILEEKAAKKYFLSKEQTERLVFNTNRQEKSGGGKLFKQFPNEKYLSRNDQFITDIGTDTASTVTARYYKGISGHKENMVLEKAEINQIGRYDSDHRENPSAYRVYADNGLAPCLQTCGGVDVNHTLQCLYS